MSSTSSSITFIDIADLKENDPRRINIEESISKN